MSCTRKRLFDFILVEADGAKRKPIKAPADYEPVIPSSTTLVIGVIGLDALGKAIDEETIHRCELFCSLTGKKAGNTIDREASWSLYVRKPVFLKTRLSQPEKLFCSIKLIRRL